MKNQPTEIKMIIYDCSECPQHRVQRTPRSGYAIDYYCQLTDNRVAHYIEWPSEMPPVPNDCPLRGK